MRSVEPWARPTRQAPGLRLLCLPYAGGGTVDFRAYADHLPRHVEVVPVVLAGREGRLKERPVRRMAQLVQALADGLAPLFEEPWALWGYSMGSWVGYELVRELRRRGQPGPVRLIVAARQAPHLPSRLDKIGGLPEAEFLVAIQARYGAIPAQLLANPGMLRLFLPALRADIALLDGYTWAAEPPLSCPIDAFWGQEDGTIRSAEVHAWAQHTTGAFQTHPIAGGHFFLRDARAEVGRRLCGLLEDR